MRSGILLRSNSQEVNVNKKIISISVIGSGLIILDTFGGSHALTLLVFAGLVPGTDIRIGAVDMLSAYATAFTVVVLYVAFGARVKAFFFQDFEATKAPVAKRSRKRTA